MFWKYNWFNVWFFKLAKYQCFENTINSMYGFQTWKVPMFWKYNYFNVWFFKLEKYQCFENTIISMFGFSNLKSTNVLKFQLFQYLFQIRNVPADELFSDVFKVSIFTIFL